MAKPRSPKLKVFRTAAGFHDAFVAAPSQKAALEAWGADSNLFAQGLAEAVTDPALMAAPLARPGEVVRVARGSAAEHVRALGDLPARKARARAKDEAAPAPSAAPKPRKPSRAAVDKAEAALAKAEEAHRRALERLRAEQEALDARRREAEQRHRAELQALGAGLDDARDRYRRAMAEWAG